MCSLTIYFGDVLLYIGLFQQAKMIMVSTPFVMAFLIFECYRKRLSMNGTVKPE